MEVWEAVVLGLVQGLTEFLPVSSSGHLQIFNTLFGLQGEENLTFAVAVHAAGPVDRRIFSFPVERRNDLYLQNNAFDGTGGDRRIFL